MVKKIKRLIWLAKNYSKICKAKKVKDISYKTIQELYKKAMPKATLFLVDSMYYVPTLNEVVDFLNKDHTNNLKYVKETFDCDDFAVLLAGLSRIESNFRLGISVSKIHAYNTIPVIIDNKMTVVIIEPQTDEIFSVKEAGKGSEAYHTVFVWL